MLWNDKKILTYNGSHSASFNGAINFMGIDRFKFSLEDSVENVHSRCLSAIEILGWKVRQDLTKADLITCYVPITDLLPKAPVYSISLYPLDNITHVALVAANDDLSRSHSVDDLPKLKAAIVAERKSIPVGNMRSQGQCFISYRRYDSADVVGRIYDRLVVTYGADKIFKDVDNIPIGTDFRKVLDKALANCTVLLVIIGRDWLNVTNERNQPRLADPADFVRIEIETALKHDIPIVPVFVRDAPMLRAEELPKSLQDLVYRNGIQIRSDPDFHHDMDRLIQSLSHFLQK